MTDYKIEAEIEVFFEDWREYAETKGICCASLNCYYLVGGIYFFSPGRQTDFSRAEQNDKTQRGSGV